MIEDVTKANLAKFLSQKPYSVLHIDASWDGYRQIMVEKILPLESKFQSNVSFGYMDCDTEQDFAREVGVVNVPAVAYYQGSNLIGLVIGLGQDIAQNIRRTQQGEALDTTNRVSRG